ncbi:unnamed protein product [Linum tenue]|uniref:Uncharacterized protein n=1 Tax=Linum tenue TaxID=586396 RepID=A0AAV0KRY3_9ROSI|nr:unnamed protein product [Linum tenue]
MKGLVRRGDLCTGAPAAEEVGTTYRTGRCRRTESPAHRALEGLTIPITVIPRSSLLTLISAAALASSTAGDSFYWLPVFFAFNLVNFSFHDNCCTTVQFG